jgi:hypothetical protein
MTGFKSKQMITFMGRGTGKSVWGQMVKDLTPPNIKLLDSAQVDGKTWHTVQLSYPVAEWIRNQEPDRWYEHVATQKWEQRYFDVHESLYTMLMLKWN